MPIFRKKENNQEDKFHRILSLIDRYVPQIRKMRETLTETLHVSELLIFQLEDLQPTITSLETNVKRLNENLALFKESLKRHGFDEKKQTPENKEKEKDDGQNQEKH